MVHGELGVVGRSAAVVRRRRAGRRSRARAPTPACTPSAGSVDAANSAVGHGGLVTTSAATDETGIARIATTPLLASFQAAATGGSLTSEEFNVGFRVDFAGLSWAYDLRRAHATMCTGRAVLITGRCRPVNQAQTQATPESCIECPEIGFHATLVGTCCSKNATYTCTPSVSGNVRGLWQAGRDNIRTALRTVCGSSVRRLDCIVLANDWSSPDWFDDRANCFNHAWSLRNLYRSATHQQCPQPHPIHSRMSTSLAKNDERRIDHVRGRADRNRAASAP